MMKMAMGCLLLTAGLTPGPANNVAAQDASRVRTELADAVQVAGSKVVSLAEAMPQEKYSWRPGDGVRSVSEVYMHIVGTNYWFTTLVGGVPPKSSGVTADYNSIPPLEKETNKEAVVKALRASFDYLEDFIRNAPPERLNEAVNLFGKATTYRGVLVETTTHLHEHLGQSIAYARMNGVVPPWSR